MVRITDLYLSKFKVPKPKLLLENEIDPKIYCE